MFFTLSKILAILVEPLAYPYLLLAVAVVMRWRRRRRMMKICIAGALLLPLLYGVLFLSRAPLQYLESRYDIPALSGPPVDGVIVLGGHTVFGDISESRNQPQQNRAADRLTKGLMLHRTNPGSTLLFSGFDGRLTPAGWSEAETIRRLVAELGVANDGIIYESTSRNTYENAVNSLAVAVPQPGSRWVLVTSAAHMPRAKGAFAAAGWDSIIAYPVDFQTGTGSSDIFDLEAGTDAVRTWLHEFVGIAAYWATGRSAILIP
jgi:uncharacterized SAM-binding protein YcdF (DUF218 family)